MRHQQLILVQPKQCDHGSDDTLLHSQIAFIALRKCLTVYCSGLDFFIHECHKTGFSLPWSIEGNLGRYTSTTARMTGKYDTKLWQINFWSQTSTVFFKNISMLFNFGPNF